MIFNVKLRLFFMLLYRILLNLICVVVEYIFLILIENYSICIKIYIIVSF